MRRNRKWQLIILAGLLMAVTAKGCVVGPGPRTVSAVTYTDGAAYRTFTEPLPKVSTAAMRALDGMGIRVRGQERRDQLEVIRGEAGHLQVQVQLEAITASSTRMQAIAREGMFSKDQPTAVEIVVQTENALNGSFIR